MGSKLKKKIEEGKLYLLVTGKSEVKFKLTEGEVKEFIKNPDIIGKHISLVEFKWIMRGFSETNKERFWYRMGKKWE